MKGDWNWAVTVGSRGVFFGLAPGNSASAPPDVEIRAILPDRLEMSPTLTTVDDEGTTGGYWFSFDPPLPDGSVVYQNGSVICTIGPPNQ